ncbi:MAG: hypothetical protein ACK42E_05915, partial [Candidatus Bipolaricaulaceae bacterium]
MASPSVPTSPPGPSPSPSANPEGFCALSPDDPAYRVFISKSASLCYRVLVNPRIPLATAPVFHGWDGVDRGPLIDWKTGRNDLETPARALVPEIGAVLNVLSGARL